MDFQMRPSLSSIKEMQSQCEKYIGETLKDLKYNEVFHFKMNRDWFAVWHCPERFEILSKKK